MQGYDVTPAILQILRLPLPLLVLLPLPGLPHSRPKMWAPNFAGPSRRHHLVPLQVVVITANLSPRRHSLVASIAIKH